jgi:hypothetical protein
MKVIVRGLLVVLSFGGSVTVRGDCSGARWPVKVAADTDAQLVNVTAIPTTIAVLRSLPATRPLPQESRVGPVEKTMYAVTATLTEYRVDEDGDAQLILSDSTGRTLLVEIPSGPCVAGSRFASDIAAARREFNRRLPTATILWQRTMTPIEIHGIAFYDFLLGQRGMASNGVTIHPSTFITFAPLVSPSPPKPPARRRAAGPHLSTCTLPSLTLTANRSSACAQEPITLTWQASDPGARVTIDSAGGTFPSSGNTAVASSFSAAFSGHATNACGQGAEAVAVVAIRPAGAASLSGPTTLQRGTNGTLSFFLANTSSWTLSSSLHNPLSASSGTGSGSFTATYTATSAGSDTVTLTPAGGCGSLTRSISIFVSQPVNQGLLCCDGTRSPTCFSCSSKQGCCSGHKGVCGCP